MRKNILVTGANGQLGREIRLLVDIDMNLDKYEFYFTDRNKLDITDEDNLEDYIKTHKIHTIINCAAYTAVDKAENNEYIATLVNKDAVRSLAQISKDNNILFIHVSTDYVFDGNSFMPMTEVCPTNPQGVYGKTKLAGEEEIVRINPQNAIIIRASWIYSDLGTNFVNTILNISEVKSEINVVCDQLGTPTYAKDLAKTILKIMQHEDTFDKSINKDTEVYHYSNEGSCSWYDFAKTVFELTHNKCQVNPIPSAQYPTSAQRPHYSILSKDKIKQAYNLTIPYWKDALEKCLSLKEIKRPLYKIGIIGSGFIAGGLAKLLAQHPEYEISAILTRSDLSKRKDFDQNRLLTNKLEDLINKSDLIVECTGDAIYATETIDKILKANIPVVTMNSEFHVTTGSYFVDKGLVTEAEGDQPGVQAILHEEALQMGFKPVVYANIKGFLNEDPTLEDMEYWGEKSNLSLEMVTSFTDGTKVEVEQVLVANGLGAGIIQDGLLKPHCDDMLEGGTQLALKAKELGYPVSDYLLSATLPAGVFLIVEHNENQADSLRYYKLGDGPYYVLERTYHLCHLEIVKTIKRVLTGGGVLLNNSSTPQFSVATVAKHDLHPGDKITKGIGSFDVRGIAITIKDDKNHVPIGLLANAKIVREVKKGERLSFDDIEIEETAALKIWKEIIAKI